jgi:hypothetical protein
MGLATYGRTLDYRYRISRQALEQAEQEEKTLDGYSGPLTCVPCGLLVLAGQ